MHRACLLAVFLGAAAACAACDDGDDGDDRPGEPDAAGAPADAQPAPADATTPAGRAITPGAGIGDLTLGLTWAEARARLGEPTTPPVVLIRLAHVRWPEAGLEAVLTSPAEATLTDDAVIIGVAATAPSDFTGPVVPGAARDAVEAALGPAPDEFGGRAYYPLGLSVEYAADSDTVARVAVVAPYTLAPDPPPMQPAAGLPAPAPAPAAPRPTIDVGGEALAVVDMHLHPADYATMAATGKAFITANLPPFLAPYVPDLLDRLSDPYAKHVGVAEQLALAGVAHGVLFAVYTQHSTGYLTNERLEEYLADPRNVPVGPAGEPRFWGFVSLNFDDWASTPELAGDRLDALASYFTTAPGKARFLGIKLAHAHQQVSFTDAAYHGVYQVAAEQGVPVLLHTGFSPFPGTEDDPAYYDPLGLEALVTAYDGAHGLPRVDFVLSHVGQGDARAVEHALDLAEAHDNVWLELSALGRPLLVDLDGAPVSTTEPQFPYVLAQLRERGLIGRALFASDGPQYSGAVRSYLGRLVTGMQDAGYTTDEIAAVLADNFARLYLGRDTL